MAIDARWLEEVKVVTAKGVRDLVMTRTSVNDDALFCAARRLVNEIPPAPDPQHVAMLTTHLLAACHRLVLDLHAITDIVTATPSSTWACTCRSVAWSSADAFVTSANTDPAPAFAGWLNGFLAHFAREHPQSTATRAAALVRADPARSWTLCELAQRVNARRSEVRRQFRLQFGLRVQEYVQLVRAARAVSLFDSPAKVESIAWDVGYRSKKDLYASLKRWVGATPAELRTLTAGERQWIEEGLRERMRGRTVLGAGC